MEWLKSNGSAAPRSGFRAAPLRLPVLPKIKHEAVALEFEDTRGALKLRGRYMTVEVDKGNGETARQRE